MSTTELQPTEGEGMELPPLRDYLLSVSMQLLGFVYERSGVTCDYDLTAFPAPALKWEQKDPEGSRAAYMVSQAARKMGFHGCVAYHPSGSDFGTAGTKPSLDYYTCNADPAFIALLVIYRGISDPDPLRGMEALDFADEWISRMMEPKEEGEGRP